MRPSGRSPRELRPFSLERGVSAHAEGSVLVTWGGTKVLCTASVEERVPSFLKGKGEGWLTAEYGMLPRATHTRTMREAMAGRQGGRTAEIQRLIGRSLRQAVDMALLGERTVTIDCDVLQADGGTRVASITGGMVALYEAMKKITEARPGSALPIRCLVAAVSVGMLGATPILDLDYQEDSACGVDMNVVMAEGGRFVEVQGTAERAPFRRAELDAMLDLADLGIKSLIAKQKAALGIA